jgi:hypothetical protein
VIIFGGLFTPNFIVDIFVASEKVGDGGPGDVLRRELKDNARSELAAMVGLTNKRQCFGASLFVTRSLPHSWHSNFSSS